MGILKKIGKWVLFFVLGAIALPIVLLLLIILLVFCLGQVKYNVDAKVGDETAAHVEIRYFLRLVRLVVSYVGGETKIRGRIAWVRIGEDKARKEKKRRRVKGRKRKKRRVINNVPEDSNVNKDVRVSDEAKAPDESKPFSKGIATDSTPDEEKNDRPSFIERVKQIRATLTEIDVKTIIGLVFQCLQKFVKAIKPKRFKISGVVGFDDPATTGWAMGAYEAFVGVTGLRPHIRLLGSYHEKALRLDIHARGRIRVIRLFTPFIWLYLKKPIRTLIHKHLLRKGD